MRNVCAVVVCLALAACGGASSGPECDWSTCPTGCCVGDTCVGGTHSTACGTGGAACVACFEWAACLSNQSCGLDPASVWRVQPISATIAASDNGTAWDGDGSAPDPQVALSCPPDSQGLTPEASNTYSPTWSSGGCTARADALLSSGFAFQVYDVDAFDDDTITAAISINGLAAGHFAQGFADINPTGGLVGMRVALQKQ